MPTPTPQAPNPAVAQAADTAVDDLLGDLSFTADADATETPAADDDAAAAVEGEGEVAAEGGEAGAAEGEVEAAAAAEGEGEVAGAVDGEGEGDAAKKDEDAAAAAKPPEKPAAPPAVDPAVAAREAAQAQAYQTWEKDFTSIDEKIAANKYDPIDDGPAAVKVMSQGMKYVRQAIGELHRQQEQFQTERAAERFWTDWGRQNPAIGADKGQAAFQEEFTAALKKHGDPRVATAVAEERWAARMKVTAGVAKSKLDSAAVARPAAAASKPPAKPAGKPPAPVTPGGGRVLPAGASATKAPATRPKTFKEKFETGAYGNLAGLVD